MTEPDGLVLFAGIDWATEKHDECLVDPMGRVLEERAFPATAEGLWTDARAYRRLSTADPDIIELREWSRMAETRRSGKSRIVVMRKACNPRLRNALYHWARVAAVCDPVWRAKY